LRRQSQMRSANSAASNRGERWGRLERSKALVWRPPSSQRCHQRCAVADRADQREAAGESELGVSVQVQNLSRSQPV
jgi:hypothetical protein